MQNILFISWSPKKWNTDTLLSHIFDESDGNKSIILLREKNIKHCLWCWFCEKHGVCAIKDDMQDITQDLLWADIIVFWSPNYFANISGISKIFIDRTLSLYYSQGLKGKKIFLVMPGASSDSTNKKYLLQAAFWFIHYQHMKLLWAYGYCTGKKSIFDKKIKNITKQIVKKMSE